ncbi:MAG: Gfo/Idh/MocA family oxidoreductase [Betaproteobacteria bacterium]|nr:Gfo/Idh/MocA family oxidoreductase [Betaproteobacteria bacterium]
MKTVRWGMIGCGDVAEVKSGPGFYQADHSSLVAVMRRNGARAADFAQRHGVARWSDDAQAILNAPDIDAVYIATLTDSHCHYTLRCAQAGKPVYVEKPMAMNHGEALEMIEACRSAGVPLWVGYYRRALPRFLKVKQLVEAGAIGAVRVVISRQTARLPNQCADDPIPWRVNPALSGGGFFFEAACHTFDFLDYLFGPIVKIEAIAGNQANAYKPEDVVVAAYRFQSGIHGSGTWCYTADEDHEMNEIIGTTGRIQFSTSQPVPIRLLRGGSVEEFHVGDPPYVHQPMIQTIVNELNGMGQCSSTGSTAARTAWVMEEILKGFRMVPPK